MQKAKRLKIVSIILFLLGLLFVVVAAGYFATSDYSYYQSQYWECHDGWYDCIQARSEFSYGSYFYNFYDLLADKWQDLMDTWEGYMYEIQMITGLIATPGILLVFVSIILRIVSGKAKKKAKKELEMQQQQMAMGMMPGAQMAPNGFAQPMMQPMAQPMGQPMMQPMAQPMMQPMAQPMTPPIAPVMAPVASPVSTPVEQTATPVSPVEPIAPVSPVAPIESAVDLDEEITIN